MLIVLSASNTGGWCERRTEVTGWNLWNSETETQAHLMNEHVGKRIGWCKGPDAADMQDCQPLRIRRIHTTAVGIQKDGEWPWETYALPTKLTNTWDVSKCLHTLHTLIIIRNWFQCCVLIIQSSQFNAAALTGEKKLVLDEAGTFRSDASAFLFRLEPSPACELLPKNITVLNFIPPSCWCGNARLKDVMH